jgi:hypothetical protein
MPKFTVKNYTKAEKAKMLEEIVEGLRNGEITNLRQIRSKLKILIKDKKINRTCRKRLCDCIVLKDRLCRRHYFAPIT